MSEKIVSIIDCASDLLGRSAAWLTLAMVLLMATIVLLRYGFNFGSIAMQELVVYLNAAVFSLGAAFTLKQQGHVRVDVFYSNLSRRKQNLIDLCGGILLLVPSMAFIVIVSWDYVALSWRLREGSPEASGLQYIYLLKSTIILLAVLMLVQGVAEILKSLSRLTRESRPAESG